VVEEVLGDKAHPDYRSPSPTNPIAKPQQAASGPLKNESIGVVTIGEAAIRLNMSKSEVERLVAGGVVKSLRAGWTTVVPTTEVERIRSARE
jgi:hypothetical protein